MFVLSKIVSFLIDPYNLLILSGLICGWGAWRAVGRGPGGFAMTWLRRGLFAFVLVMASLYVLPLGGWLVRPLERVTFDSVHNRLGEQAKLAGTIVLGGAANGRVSRVRGVLELSEQGDRVLSLLEALAQTDQPVIYTGIYETAYAKARLAPLLSADQLDRLIIEPHALTTAEHPWRIQAMGYDFDRDPKAYYRLVTSAFHMPRAVAVFEKAGVRVQAMPTDYLAQGRDQIGWNPRVRYQVDLLRLGIKEYIGLVGYRLAGKI